MEYPCLEETVSKATLLMETLHLYNRGFLLPIMA